MPDFRMFEDKLNIDLSCQPILRFGHSPMKNEQTGEVAEIIVFHCTYLVSDEVFFKIKNIQNQSLDLDFEIDKIMRAFAFCFLSSMQEKSEFRQSFVIKRYPLKIQGKDTIRNSIYVSVPSHFNISNEELVDIGEEFIKHFPMHPIDVESFVSYYNNEVDGYNEDIQNEEMYCYHLPSLSTLVHLPFKTKGKVYHFKGAYLYETDTPLFDFLDEYTEGFSKEHVAIEDISPLYEREET